MSFLRVTCSALLVATLANAAPSQEAESKLTAVPWADDPEIWPDEISGPWTHRDPASLPGPIVPESWLVLPRVEGRDAWSSVAPFLLDPARVPKATSATETSPTAWRTFVGPEPTEALCAYTSIHVDQAQIRMARLDGAAALVLNGEVFVGDRASFDFQGVPVALRSGVNHVLVVDASDSFRLELWAPFTRKVIGTWDVTWPYSQQLGDDLTFPIFNACLEPCQGIHVHYGHGQVEGGERKPVVTDWRDCGLLAPLGMFMGATYFQSLMGDSATDPEEGTLTPVCVFGAGDPDADRQLLRHPKGARNANRSLAHRSRAMIDGSLFSRLGGAPVLVYGTQGSPEEAAALLARARYDQQVCWYQTASIPFLISDELYWQAVTDQDWIRSQIAFRARGSAIVLYGNEDTNSAWSRCMGNGGPVRANRQAVLVKGKPLVGDDVTGWVVLPSKGGAAPFVGMISTGLSGSRAGYLMRAVTKPVPSVDFAFYRLGKKDSGSLEQLVEGSL